MNSDMEFEFEKAIYDATTGALDGYIENLELISLIDSKYTNIVLYAMFENFVNLGNIFIGTLYGEENQIVTEKYESIVQDIKSNIREKPELILDAVLTIMAIFDETPDEKRVEAIVSRVNAKSKKNRYDIAYM